MSVRDFCQTTLKWNPINNRDHGSIEGKRSMKRTKSESDRKEDGPITDSKPRRKSAIDAEIFLKRKIDENLDEEEENQRLMDEDYGEEGEEEGDQSEGDGEEEEGHEEEMSLDISLKTATPNTPLNCQICHKVLNAHRNWFTLWRHSLKHTNIRGFKCSICGHKSSMEASLANHIRFTHKDEKTAEIVEDITPAKIIEWKMIAIRCFPEFESVFEKYSSEKVKKIKETNKAPIRNKSSHSPNGKDLIACKHCGSLIKPFKNDLINPQYGVMSHCLVHFKKFNRYTCDVCRYGTNRKPMIQCHSSQRHGFTAAYTVQWNKEMILELARLTSECFPNYKRKIDLWRENQLRKLERNRSKHIDEKSSPSCDSSMDTPSSPVKREFETPSHSASRTQMSSLRENWRCFSKERVIKDETFDEGEKSSLHSIQKELEQATKRVEIEIRMIDRKIEDINLTDPNQELRTSVKESERILADKENELREKSTKLHLNKPPEKNIFGELLEKERRLNELIVDEDRKIIDLREKQQQLYLKSGKNVAMAERLQKENAILERKSCSIHSPS